MKLSDFLSFTPDGFFRSNKRSLKKYLSSGGVITSINDIADVNVAGASNGDALVYQDGEWVPGEAGEVDSVNGQTGTVVIDKSDIGLANVDNTSDLNKPVSTAVQTALDSKAALVHTHGISDVTGLQAALDSKATTTALSTLQTTVDGKAPIAAAVIAGGTTGQVLKKASNANYDLIWAQDESTIYVTTYADLPDPTTVSGKTYGVLTSTGVAYISVLFGGNYRAKGFYYSNGTEWIYVGEFPMQASNSEVQAGTVTDKFVAPNTLRASYFYNGGNSFGGNSTIGTNDAFSFSIKTNNLDRFSINSSGIGTFNTGLRLDTGGVTSIVGIYGSDTSINSIGVGLYSGNIGRWRVSMVSDRHLNIQRADASGNYTTIPSVRVSHETGNVSINSVSDTGDTLFVGGNIRASRIGLGGSASPSNLLVVPGALTGSTTSHGVYVYGTAANDVTSTAVGFRGNVGLAANTALSNVIQFWATRGTYNAGSSATRTMGFWADSGLGTGGGIAYGFRGSLAASGANNWNLLMDGDAPNYFAGKILVKTTTDGGFDLDVNGSARLSGFTFGTIGGPRYIATVPSGFSYEIFHRENTAIGVNFGANGTTTLSTGSRIAVNISDVFSPTAGSVTATGLNISQTINQTGGANGVTRAIFINPSLTSAANYRAIEWTNSTGWGLYGAGDVQNFLAGQLVIGTAGNAPARTLAINKPLTGASTGISIVASHTILSDVTTAHIFYSGNSVASNHPGVTNLNHFTVAGSTLNTNASIVNQTGFLADNGIINAANNYGFRGRVPAGSNNWNLYMEGTANNYLGGSLGIGTTALSISSVRLSLPITGSTTAYGIYNTGTVSSGVATARFNYTLLAGQAGSTPTTVVANGVAQGTYLGTAPTNQYGFIVESSLIGATNNYGFFGNIPFGGGRWNLYMDGGASNYLYGKLLIGSNVDSGTEALQVTGGAVVAGTLKVTNIVTSNNHNDSILMHSGTEIKKTRYLKNTYRAMVGESLNDTGMTGLYDRDELVIADKKYNVTVNITGGGTFNPAHLSRIFGTPDVSAFADISGLTANSVMTIDVEIVGDGLPNYSKASWHPFIQTRLSIASGGAYTYFKKITVYVSENGTDWFTSNTPSAWRCDNFDTQQTIPGYWIGSENSYSGATYRPKWVRFVFEECIPGTTYGYWLQRIGFRHTNAPYAAQYLHKGEGGTVYGSTKFTKGVIVDYTPSSSTDSSLPVGSITADNAYLYRRATTGEWKKIAWTTF